MAVPIWLASPFATILVPQKCEKRVTTDNPAAAGSIAHSGRCCLLLSAKNLFAIAAGAAALLSRERWHRNGRHSYAILRINLSHELPHSLGQACHGVTSHRGRPLVF